MSVTDILNSLTPQVTANSNNIASLRTELEELRARFNKEMEVGTDDNNDYLTKLRQELGEDFTRQWLEYKELVDLMGKVKVDLPDDPGREECSEGPLTAAAFNMMLTFIKKVADSDLSWDPEAGMKAEALAQEAEDILRSGPVFSQAMKNALKDPTDSSAKLPLLMVTPPGVGKCDSIDPEECDPVNAHTAGKTSAEIPPILEVNHEGHTYQYTVSQAEEMIARLMSRSAAPLVEVQYADGPRRYTAQQAQEKITRLLEQQKTLTKYYGEACEQRDEWERRYEKKSKEYDELYHRSLGLLSDKSDLTAVVDKMRRTLNEQEGA